MDLVFLVLLFQYYGWRCACLQAVFFVVLACSVAIVTFCAELPGKTTATNLEDMGLWDSLARWTVCEVTAACAEVEMTNWTSLCNPSKSCAGHTSGRIMALLFSCWHYTLVWVLACRWRLQCATGLLICIFLLASAIALCWVSSII